MELRLLDLLVCPIDKTCLELVEWESTLFDLSREEISRVERMGLSPALFSKEVVTGVLLNRARKIFYPIDQGIPRMLVFPTGVACKFAEKHADRIARELSGFTLPHETAMPGEETVLRTFSSEWVNYDWDGKSYWNSEPDVVYRGMNFMLDLERRPVKDKLVLEAGIGIGGIADYMARKEKCELVGIDLSYAVDPAYKHFGMNAFLHIVQASVFALPFRENTFDLVYSWGVLHHTYSTKAAFDFICKLPKAGGRLYVWVYNPSSAHLTLVRRAIMLTETVIRPLCWRLPESLQTIVLLPIIPLYLVHQNLYVRRGSSGYITYGWREAMHAARDRFTPRYAHRHTEEEVCSWFCEAGYTELRCANGRNRPDFVPASWFPATAVDGVRHSG
jgi:uncharacterized protein YbaR (Trm112 family)/SAM-dependent methyltransferase